MTNPKVSFNHDFKSHHMGTIRRQSCFDNRDGYFAGTGNRKKRVVPYYFPRFGSNNYKSFLKRFSFLGKRKRSAVDQDTGNSGIIYVHITSTRGYTRLRKT